MVCSESQLAFASITHLQETTEQRPVLSEEEDPEVFGLVQEVILL